MKAVLSLILCITFFPILALGEEESSEQIYVKASKVYKEARKQKDPVLSQSLYEESIIGFIEYLETGPKGDKKERALYRQGVSYLMLDREEEAEKSFKKLIKKFKKGSIVGAASFRMGAKRYNEEDWRNALYYFNLCIKESTNKRTKNLALYYKAKSYQELDNIKEYRKTIQKVAEGSSESNPKRLNAIYDMSLGYVQDKSYKKALKSIQPALEEQEDKDMLDKAILLAIKCAISLEKHDMARDYLSRIEAPEFSAYAREIGIMRSHLALKSGD